MATATEWDGLDAAHAALRRAVDGVAGGQLLLPTPCTQWTVSQVVEHAVFDQGIWASAAGDAEPPPEDAFAPTGALPADVAGMVDSVLRQAALVRTGWVLADELAAQLALAPTAHHLVEPLSQWGASATAQPPELEDSPAEALLRFLGRDPHWTATSR